MYKNLHKNKLSPPFDRKRDMRSIKGDIYSTPKNTLTINNKLYIEIRDKR